MNAFLNILLVDDDSGDARIIERAIRQSGLAVQCVVALDLDAARKSCQARDFDVAIVDYQLPGENGLEALVALGETCPFMPIIMSTGHGDEIVATEAMKRGALDYIRKADITSSSIRRVIENAVEKVELRRKVAEQQRELERFADLLVHDLRAPSSSIQTFLSYLQEDLQAGHLEMILQYCEFARKAAARMDTLIATLYQYTQLHGEISFETVNMNIVLEDVLDNLHDTLLHRAAIVTHAELPRVRGNQAQLVQLLQNLVGNGLKYCENPVPAIHIDSRLTDEGMWTIAVQDNGIGIPEEEHTRIFESFTRLHGIGEYEGTGLGLATCSKIVARHGGHIYCESTPGEGSTFFFTLCQPEMARATTSTAIAA